ncbi:sensor histidine kinase [Niabella aquatica]
MLSNAIKYSPAKSKITISSIARPRVIEISIKDEGKGIKPADVERIFEHFFRVADEKSNSISGTGLGLYISNQIIQKHQGSLSVQSTYGEGALFLFTIPVL